MFHISAVHKDSLWLQCAIVIGLPGWPCLNGLLGWRAETNHQSLNMSIPRRILCVYFWTQYANVYLSCAGFRTSLAGFLDYVDICSSHWWRWWWWWFQWQQRQDVRKGQDRSKIIKICTLILNSSTTFLFPCHTNKMSSMKSVSLCRWFFFILYMPCSSGCLFS